MEEKITLEMVVSLIVGSMLFSTFLWGILYILIKRKFDTVFLMLQTMSEGISGQNVSLNKCQNTIHKDTIGYFKSIGDNQAILQKEIKKLNNKDKTTTTQTLDEKES